MLRYAEGSFAKGIKAMKFGPHTKSVEEVIDFLNSAHLLQGGHGNNSWAVVHDLATATQLAWNTADDHEGLTWADVREREMAEVRGESYSLSGFADAKDELSRLLTSMTKQVRSKLDKTHSELLDDIVGDLYCCAYSRAVRGEQGFFEMVFDAYKSGGWPCGWQGNFPVGQLIVYLRQ